MDTRRMLTYPTKYLLLTIVTLLFTHASATESVKHRYEIDLSSSVSSLSDGMQQMSEKLPRTPVTKSTGKLRDDRAEFKMATDKESGGRVIATRIIETKYKEGILIDNQTESITSTYGLIEKSHFPRLRTIFWESGNFSKLQRTIDALNEDERFEFAKLQVIDHINTPR